MKKDDRERCSWATTELYKEYHDEEWGKPGIIMADDIK